MKLGQNWITEHLIDLEYKQYQVLGYIQSVKSFFRENKVYPHLSDLVSHYNELVALWKKNESFKNALSRDIEEIRWQSLEIKYKDPLQEQQAMEEVMKVVEFAMPVFLEGVQDGKKIFQFVEQHLRLQAIGISPINQNEGYLILHQKPEQFAKVYQYRISVIDHPEDRARCLETTYVRDYESGLKFSFPQIKSDLIHKYKELPNPCVYGMETDLQFPWEDTFLPIAKRVFMSRMAA